MNGRVCLVTGAASGIGEAIARRLAAAGGMVVGVDLRPGGAAEVSADVSVEADVVADARGRSGDEADTAIHRGVA